MGESTSSECVEAITLRRAEAILGIANEFQSGVVPRDLLDLLPDGALWDLSKLRLFLERSGMPLSWADGRMFVGENPPAAHQQDHRTRRAQENWDSIQREVPRVLDGVLPVLRSLSVTGSLAFGESSEKDDVDFFAISRRGGVWLFLFLTYVAGRFRRTRPDPVWCFNTVLEEEVAVGELSKPLGFVMAREILMARCLWGNDYYVHLLQRADWIRREIPRLYEARLGSTPPPSASPVDPVAMPWPLRALNAAIFPLLATYLQLVGLLRNWRFRREGRASELFRTHTRYREMRFTSAKFEQILQRGEGASVIPPQLGSRRRGASGPDPSR